MLRVTKDLNAKICSHAVMCLSYFVPISASAHYARIDTFIAYHFKRASDEELQVYRHVCQVLDPLASDKVLPELGTVAEYMVFSTKDKNEVVALEASEF